MRATPQCLILPVFDFEDLAMRYGRHLARYYVERWSITCPTCGSSHLNGHGSRQRRYQERHWGAYAGHERPQTQVVRLQCQDCVQTYTLLPRSLAPKKLYTTGAREAARGTVRGGSEPPQVARGLGMPSAALIRYWLSGLKERENQMLVALTVLLVRELSSYELVRGLSPRAPVSEWIFRTVQRMVSATLSGRTWVTANLLSTIAWKQRAVHDSVAL